MTQMSIVRVVSLESALPCNYSSDHMVHIAEMQGPGSPIVMVSTVARPQPLGSQSWNHWTAK